MLNALPSRRAGMLAAALLLAVAAASFTTPADAQWRWRDASGRINASDRPPPKEVPDKDILSRPQPAQRRAAAVAESPSAPASGAPVAASASAPANGLKAQVDAQRKRAEQEQAARAKAEEARLAAQRAENCRRARAHAAAIESGQRLARTNERGEREVLDDRGRAEELRSARAVIASDCR